MPFGKTFDATLSYGWCKRKEISMVVASCWSFPVYHSWKKETSWACALKIFPTSSRDCISFYLQDVQMSNLSSEVMQVLGVLDIMLHVSCRQVSAYISIKITWHFSLVLVSNSFWGGQRHHLLKLLLVTLPLKWTSWFYSPWDSLSHSLSPTCRTRCWYM